MNRHGLKILAVVVVALIVALVAMEAGERNGSTGGGKLLPDLKAHINDVTSVTVTYPDDGGSATLERSGGGWVVAERHGYPADVAELRKLLLAMADATVVEQKTSDPERYDRLGVQDPEAPGSEGIRIAVAGDGVDVRLIVGKSASPGTRYVRRDGEEASWLVNTDPAPPAGVAGWLSRALIDLDAKRVRSVEIVHADGETIRIAKENESDPGFAVQDIPAGRELSYPTIGNSIGGALNDVQLDDVRQAEPGEAAFTTTFETFDGLRVTLEAYEAEDGLWLGFEAGAVAAADDAAAPAGTPGAAAEAAADDGAPAEQGGEAAGPDGAPAASAAPATPDPAAEAAGINASVAGWQFRIPDYKTDQLGRRWADLLKAAD